MSRAIRLVRLTARNVGPLLGSVTVGPFKPGINVISGGNEAGKSTLVESLRVALFEKYSTKNRGIAALQPHDTRLGPEVEVELSIDGEQIRVRKRFLERPMAEVRLGDGTALRDRDADEFLLSRLEGRSPKKSGVTREDMGVWGLLWVTQDETAYADPGGTLDEEVRGSLADAVGRQVGTLTGGKHGERIRARVLEEVGQFFTPKRDQPTGEYKQAQDKRRAADEKVARIEQAVREIEEIEQRWVAETAKLQELERDLPALRAELEAARQQARALEQQEARLREVKAQAAAAEATCAARQRDVDERAAKAREVAELEVVVARERQRLDEMERLLAERACEDEEARQALEAQDTALNQMRTRRDALGQRLAAARAQSEVSRLTDDVRRAEAIAGELEEVERERAEIALDDHAYKDLQTLSHEVVVLRARLEAEGTRVVARAGEGQRKVWIAASGASLDLPGLGTITLTPARSGLARAAGLAREARASLNEALLAVGAESAQHARERRAERAEAEADAEALRASFAELAPEGLDQLAHQVAATTTARQQAENDHGLATRAQAELEPILANLAKLPLDARALENLRALAHQAELAQVAWAASGTELTVRALADVRVRLGDGAPDEQLAAGQTRTQRVAKPTVLVLGDTELTLAPRGQDLAKAAARKERADRELASALRTNGVETLAEAERAAQAHAEAEQAKAAVEQRLAAAAPRGTGALRTKVKRLRTEAQATSTRLRSAREASARLATLEVALTANRVSRKALERIEALSRTHAAREAEVAGCAARLRWASGPRAGQEDVIPEPIRLETAGEVTWEVIPGESDEAAALAQAGRALAEALASAGVSDLEAAKARWMAGLTLKQRQTRLAEDLRRVAPGGLEALRARHRAVEVTAFAGAPEDEREAPSAEAIEALIEPVRAEIARAEAERAALQGAATSRAEARRSCDREVSELRGQWRRLQSQREVARDRLTSLRSAAPDAHLEDQLSEARDELRAAQDALEAAARELAAAAPELNGGEVARAEGALDAQEVAARKLRDSVIKLKTLLDRAALEGRFEELGEARADQAEAAEAFERVERDARAARLLADLVEEAYAGAQRMYLAPVTDEVGRYLKNLRPDTEIQMTNDLRLAKVIRRGIQEEFDRLSGGTREQLSVIVRIALARVFARDRRPLPLILDDTLGWTDDARFLSMVKILRDAAKDLQLILLTCHGSRFERLRPDYCADLDELKRQAGSEA